MGPVTDVKGPTRGTRPQKWNTSWSEPGVIRLMPIKYYTRRLAPSPGLIQCVASVWHRKMVVTVRLWPGPCARVRPFMGIARLGALLLLWQVTQICCSEDEPTHWHQRHTTVEVRTFALQRPRPSPLACNCDRQPGKTCIKQLWSARLLIQVSPHGWQPYNAYWAPYCLGDSRSVGSYSVHQWCCVLDACEHDP